LYRQSDFKRFFNSYDIKKGVPGTILSQNFDFDFVDGLHRFG